MSSNPSAGADRQESHEPTSTTNTGLEENDAAALSYVLGWITGIVMYVVEPDDESIRFHAAQSIVVFGGFSVLVLVIGFLSAIISALAAAGGMGVGVFFGLFSMIMSLISFVVWIAGLGLWLYLLVRTYQGQDPRVPVAAGIANSIA
jgi:uncharacterized membrane protein